jgi:glucose-1-phosphate thymidylyltransferase
MHKYVREDDLRRAPGEARPQELFIGEVIQAAIEAGMPVDSELFADGHFVDIGTPDDLIKAIRSHT